MSGAKLVAIEGGDLGIGEGLLSLLRPALLLLDPGGELILRSQATHLLEDLKRWCEIEQHEITRAEPSTDHLSIQIRRGPFPKLVETTEKTSLPLSSDSSSLSTQKYLTAYPFLPEGPERSCLALRGSSLELGSPASSFPLRSEEVASFSSVGELYDQAVKNQWRADDIEWSKIKPLADPIESALTQALTFLAENEVSALYLPSRFISQIHPFFCESALFLATQINDEARHIDVFLKRARLHRAKLGVSSVVTSRSLLSLLAARDFLEAEFLLSVLGEGTFLDLLTFLEKEAPDEPTANLFQRVRMDEARHVHFAMAHVRHTVESQPDTSRLLVQAVDERASRLGAVSSAPTYLQDALVVLGAKSTEPSAIRHGQTKYQELLETMESNRIKRLTSIGLELPLATEIARRHTPNFM